MFVNNLKKYHFLKIVLRKPRNTYGNTPTKTIKCIMNELKLF